MQRKLTLILSLFLLSLFIGGCPLVRATGDVVEATGDGVGHVVEETGDAVGRAGREITNP